MPWLVVAEDKSNFHFVSTIYWPIAYSLCQLSIKEQYKLAEDHKCVHCIFRPASSFWTNTLDGSNVPLKTCSPPLPSRQKGTCIWCFRLCMKLLPCVIRIEWFFRCISIKWICPEFSKLEGNERLETMIFNLSVLFRVGLNGFPLTSVKMLTAVSVLYDGVHIHCNTLYFEANILCQAFFLTSDQPALFADWSTLTYVIRRTKQYLAICNTANYT